MDVVCLPVTDKCNGRLSHLLMSFLFMYPAKIRCHQCIIISHKNAIELAMFECIFVIFNVHGPIVDMATCSTV